MYPGAKALPPSAFETPASRSSLPRAAALSIGDYIDGFYNIQRRHSAIN